jgi:tetratricopeptide (TPR) repeat protein
MKKLLLFSALAAAVSLLPKNNFAAAPSAVSNRQAEALAAVKTGDVAAQSQNWREAIADYKRAIELDPANGLAEKKFLNSNDSNLYRSRPSKPAKHGKKLTKKQRERLQKFAEAKQQRANDKLAAKLLKTYDAWIRKNPNDGLFYWGKGRVLESQGKRAEALALFQKAIKIDPSCAAAYASLADAAATDSNVAEERKYAQKSLALDPQDTFGAFFNYALTYLSTDPLMFSRLVEDRARKFPDHGSMDELLDLAAQNEPANEAARLYETIYKDFGPRSSHPSGDIDDLMVDYFNLEAKSDPAKALALARRIETDETAKNATKSEKSGKTGKSKKPENPWATLSRYEASLLEARTLLSQSKSKEALALLDKNKLSAKGDFGPLSGVSHTPYELEKAQALVAADKLQEAYASLKTALLAQPDSAIDSALMACGTRLGKSPAQIREDVWKTRETKAKFMKPFDLKQYVTNKEVKLADFRGHVTLVNFWFPG